MHVYRNSNTGEYYASDDVDTRLAALANWAEVDVSLAPADAADILARRAQAAANAAAGDLGRVTLKNATFGSLRVGADLGDVHSVASAQTNLGLSGAVDRPGALFEPAGSATPGVGPAWAGGAASVATRFQSGHGWTVNGALTTGGLCNLNDTTEVGQGTQSVKIGTVGASGTFQMLSKTGVTAIDYTGKKIRVTLKIADTTKLATLQFQIAATGGITSNDFYTWQICNPSVAAQAAVNASMPTNKWFTIELSLADAAATGSPTIDAVTDYRFIVADGGAGTATFWLGGIDVVPTGLAKFGTNGIVALCFDDAFVGQWTYARKRLATYGMQATFLPIVQATTTGGLTVTQLRELQDAYGHEIGAHAYTQASHAGYASLTATEAEADMRSCLTWMATNGFRSRSFAYPLGWFRPNLEATRRLWRCARTVDTVGGTLKSIPTPPVDPWQLRSVSNVGGSGAGSVSVSSLTTNTTGVLDKVKAANGLLILTLHNITSGAAAALTECSDTDLGTLIDAIATKGLAVATLGQILDAAQ